MEKKSHFKDLPMVPFSIYLLDSAGVPTPKKMYTVTQKRLQLETMQLYVQELGQFIEYNPDGTVVVCNFYLN